MNTILLQKILAALTQLLGVIKTKLNTIKDNLDDLIVMATASGPIASFTTTITKPFISCKVEIKPKQASGTPTPSNPLSISGTDTVIVTQTDSDNQVITTKTVSLPQTVYGGEVDVIGGSGEKTWSDKIVLDGTEAGWTMPSTSYFAMALPNAINDNIKNTLMCDKFTADSWQRISGLSLDDCCGIVNGIQVRFHYSAVTTLDDWKTFLSNNNVSIIYELATPTQITLANPIDLIAKSGVNNVFGDTDGNTTVEYLKLYKED